MSELTHAVTDATFDLDVANADVPVLLDFWAPWCGPCKMIAPILEDVAAEFEGSDKVCKINVDENREIAARFGVRGIPTLMLFNNGEVAGTKVGALAKSDLLAFISDNT